MVAPGSSIPTVRGSLPAPGVALEMLGDSIAHRAELAALELEEAREHAAVSVLLAGASGALALLTGFALTLLAASLVWDLPHRAWWLGGLSFAYLAAGLITGLVLRRRLGTWRPLGEIQAQLREDCQCLNQLIKSAGL